MYNSLKYLELTRHHMYTKMKKIHEDNSEYDDDGFNKLTEVVFSSALSLFLTYLAETYFTDTANKPLNIGKIACLFLAAIILYCVLYVGISKMYAVIAEKLRIKKYNRRVHSPEVTTKRNKELIDDFDHIAFDNLIIAYEFVNEIENSQNSETSTFYYHEALYYLRTSVNKTKEITHSDRRKECLNIFGNVNGIDIFRLINAYKMMCDLFEKLKSILDKNDAQHIIQIYNNDLYEILLFQIGELNRDIDAIGASCDQAVKDLKPLN